MATIDVTDPAREVLNQAPPLQPINLFESTSRCARRSSAKAAAGASTACARPAPWRAASRRSSTAGAPSATCRSCSPTTATATGSTRSSSTRRGTGCCAARSSARSTACRGASRSRARTWSARRCSALWGNANDGVMCPVSMTYAAVPALRDGAPELAAEWEPRLTEPDYEHGALAGMAMTERQGGSDVRANITRAEPVGDGVVRDPRPQVVLLLSAVRRVPGARAGAGRALVLPRRARAGHGVPAAQGQARHALAAVVRGRVPRHPRPADRRGGPRRAGDHPDGQPHAARLPARLDHRAAARHARGDPPRPPPVRVRRAARRPAGDAQRARRPGDRVRGGDRRRDARRAQLRRARGRARSAGSPRR